MCFRSVCVLQFWVNCSVHVSWPRGFIVLCVFRVLLIFGSLVPPSLCAREQCPASGLPEVRLDPLHLNCGPCQLSCDRWASLATEHSPEGEWHRDPGPQTPQCRFQCPHRSATRRHVQHEQLRPCFFSLGGQGTLPPPSLSGPCLCPAYAATVFKFSPVLSIPPHRAPPSLRVWLRFARGQGQ